MSTNLFLNKLIKYEQDGKSAISSPTNWNDELLLNVKTDSDELIESISEDLKDHLNVARWHFFIGSPGNGKSAAVGKLYKKLSARNVIFKTNKNEVYKPDNKSLPYLLEGFEEGKPYSFCLFAQDASVVQDPYKEEISPAEEMLKLMESAWARKKCLIICANRGIIEDALRIGEKSEMYRNERWFKHFSHNLGKSNVGFIDFTDKKNLPSCTKIKYTNSNLDFRSIVLDNPSNNNVFDRLISQAVSNENWSECENCESKKMCSFKNNRDFLLEKSNREKFITIIKRAEVYSGQVIVFREALALIAFILAGCSEDLMAENVKSPCEWIKKKIEKDQVFDLLGRRIYMSLFSSYSPYGFEFNFSGIKKNNITKNQKNVLIDVASTTKSKDTFKRLLRKEYNRDWLSLNIGLKRLIGEKGVLKDLHPFYGIPLNNYENIIQEKYDLPVDYLAEKFENPALCDIEKSVFRKFKELEDTIITSGESIANKLGWLNRWVTNITYNIGVLDLQLTNFDKELNQLIIAFEKRDVEGQRLIKKQLSESVKVIFEDENSRKVEITENLSVYNFNIEPITISIPTDDNKTYGLSMHFGNSDKKPITINVQTYCWLTRKHVSNLSADTFPMEYLDTLKAAQFKAIKDLNFNKVSNVELRIETKMLEEYSVKRNGGEIFSEDIKKME